MADEDQPGGMKYARPFRLVPPPCDKQFRTAQLKVERTKLRAERRLEAKLDPGGEASRDVYPPELAGIWNSFALRELQADLPPHEAEELHRRLAAVLAGEEGSAAVWWATISALREARRAAEIPIGARPRKWRQSWPDHNGW